jgi:3-hydroxybutyrate dehydrogenase
MIMPYYNDPRLEDDRRHDGKLGLSSSSSPPHMHTNASLQPKTSFWALKSSTDAATSSYKVLEINLHHPIRCTQLALDTFTRLNSRGTVVMISSAAAQQPGTAIPLYAASKAAINNFVKSMAPMEPAKGVRVVAIAPGSVLTPFWTSREGWVGEGEWIPMEEVVDAMMAVITKPEYPGGTVLEITCGSTRKIELVNDPGPVAGTGATITNVALPRAEMLGLLSTEYGK